eukprot:CAMPEP_0116142318 /NCGR_PEP_ID=MMETSP0329-20121206/14845_1 /TAXON_ID=697910 /ORGANISM="Pseudo-nitzschia arenysensis, Strain B593" /LENGTH=110 /DNA_ID=CAMNT_0003637547 /DNA_START=63 /DNA_END=395 /DNA_ORIENTATION=+
MTPTKHSDATTTTTTTTSNEGTPSSPKIAAQSQDAALFISDMLSQMEEDFRNSGKSIMNRMREVGSKMDDLEQNILGLVQDAGLDEEEDSNSKASEGMQSSQKSASHMTV